MDDKLLEVKNLTVEYQTGGGSVRAVDGISFCINQGEIFALVGESGCGKSTVAAAITRLVRSPGKITDGSILLKGSDLLQLSRREIEKVRGRQIGMVFQNPLDSLNPVAYYALSVVRQQQYRIDEAMVAIESAIALDPNGVGLVAWRGELMKFRCDTDGARAAVLRALELSPRDPHRWVLFNRMGTIEIVALPGSELPRTVSMKSRAAGRKLVMRDPAMEPEISSTIETSTLEIRSSAPLSALAMNSSTPSMPIKKGWVSALASAFTVR